VNPSAWTTFREKASKSPCKIVLADGEDRRILEAAAHAVESHLTTPLLVGKKQTIQSAWASLSTKMPCPAILDFAAFSAPDVTAFRAALQGISKFKSLTSTELEQKLRDPLVLGCLAVRMGRGDGFIGGATRTTADTLRAAFSILGLKPKTSSLFGFFFIERSAASAISQDLILLADCAVIPEPSAKQLAAIGVHGAEAFQFFTGQTPRVAFLSFSTAGSAEHDRVNTVRDAVALARNAAPDVMIEGEWQADAALDTFTAGIKGVGKSPMAGQANVLVVPDLQCGNIAYKLIQRVGGCRAVGPVLWGMAHPANDLSRGCSSEDVLDMIALTSLQVYGHTNEKVNL